MSVSMVVVAFQLGVAAGAPWGEFTMGGAVRGQLPPEMRMAAVASALTLLAFCAIVASRAGIVLSRWHRWSRRLIWLVVLYGVVGVLLNAITPSARERMVWLPVAIVLAVSAVVVARSTEPVAHIP
jgi:hypothetical protein